MSVHPFLQQAVVASVDEVAAVVLNPAAVQLSPAMQAFIDLLNGLRHDLDQVMALLNGKANASTVSSLNQRLTTLSSTVDSKADATAVSQQFLAVAGIDSSQATAIAAVQQALASEDNIMQGLLQSVGAHTALLAGLRTDTDLKAPQASLSSLSGQVTVLRNTVGDASTGLAATYTLAANALPLAGGTLTGQLNVMVPAGAANPLQLSSLPLSMTFQQALPLIALGGLYSFTVAVANAVVGQVVVVNLPPTMLASGASYQAAVTAAGTVTVTLKAGAQIAAGTQTFYLRVFR